MRIINEIKEAFSYFSSPCLPKSFQESQKDLFEKSKPYQTLLQNFTIDYLKENLPHQTAYMIIQLSEDRQQLYIGYMSINKEKKFDYYMSKIILSDEKRQQLQKMVDTLAQNKITMQKTPITIEEDLQQLEQDSEQEIVNLVKQLEEFFRPVTEALEPIINPILKDSSLADIESTQNPKDAKGKADNKKQAPPAKSKAAAKGQPAELAAYESSLPLTPSGIENLILMVDHRIDTLPIETLEVFRNVPSMGRDFNLHMHMQRLKNVGHQAALHNNHGINKEELKYIVDPPTTLEEKTQTFLDKELNKMMPGSKWEGIMTKSQHIPSDGEWQRLISQSSMFAYYSMTCLLHKFPPSLISDLSIFNKCKAMVIFDRMNSYKTLIDRNMLTSKHFVPNEQPTQMIALFSLCGVSSITINHWSTKPETNLEVFENFMKGCLVDGVYVGASLKKYWQGKQP